jgi:phosphate-selective porin OprO/OprP
MYDGGDKEWHFRQTGIQVDVPELSGRVFVGRTKEGFSQNKIMVGYYIWTIERTMALDAFVPILGDGIKWMGYSPRTRIFYSLGWFGDALSEDEKFSTYDNQFVSRIAWQPLLSESKKEVLHVAVMGREGHPDNGQLQVRSRPEAYLAPYFLDTGKIKSDQAGTVGVEACYQKGPWLYSSEYDWQKVNATGAPNPVFQGGTFGVSWLVTGDTRPYNAPGAFFDAVAPKRSVFEGGPGAWETVLNYSYANFDDQGFHGGKFWRLSPTVKWHLSYNLRLELAYGYGKLDRFDLNGATQFYQARLLTML